MAPSKAPFPVSWMLDAVLARTPCAVLLLTREARLLMASPRARRLLERRDPLLVRDGALLCRQASDSRRLHDAVRTIGPGSPERLLVLVRGGASEGSVAVMLATLEQGPEILMFASDPEIGPTAIPSDLTILFGLTGAEARLVAALATGSCLDEYAQATGLSIGTVRWTLKNVFEKTGTDRQAELVRRVLVSVAGFRPC